MARKLKRQDDESKLSKYLAELLGLPPAPPDPTECPDCGASSILPICYGQPGAEMTDAARRGEIVIGGGILQDPKWYCKDCFNRWPENTPRQSLPGTPKRYLAEMAAEFASLTADAVLAPMPDEPAVENYWQRDDGRKIFLLRFPWGRMRIEKLFHLVALGGPPQYETMGGEYPLSRYNTRTFRLAALAAIRFERRAAS